MGKGNLLLFGRLEVRATVPSQQPSDNITTRFLIELFPKVRNRVVNHSDGRREKKTLGLEQWQRKAMEALGTGSAAFMPVMPKVG